MTGSNTTDDQSRLNPEFKERWLKALRSGEYKQGEGILQWNGCYCCLGVAACLIDPDGWYGSTFRGNDYILPVETMKEIGLSGQASDKLTNMNDDGDSFATIADWIEANL